MSREPERLRYGAAYYPEYQPGRCCDDDLDLMAEAGLNVIRVGESVWSTWEPTDGRFELDWLLPVLDGAKARGIGVIIGTPTYAVPPWLQRAHPEIAVQRSPGQRIPWGSRQEVNYSHPVFRRYAERVIRAIVPRYAGHPAVIGFQVDNEPGLELSQDPDTLGRFRSWLKARYGSVDSLNREWGLTYWSHRLNDWEELWTPAGNSFPQYDLDWRRFHASLTTDFISWQAAIVREYAAPDQFITTCIDFHRPAMHDVKLSAPLDVTGGNPYYDMQDALSAGSAAAPPGSGATKDAWGLYEQADRMYAARQAPFIVTETDASSIEGPSHNYPPYPGQLKQAALALVARGARMVEYWHWQSLHYGYETYWGGVLPHSMRPGRIYREIAEIGKIFQALEKPMRGFVPDADVAVVVSRESEWALQFMPPLTNAHLEPDPRSHERMVTAFYRGMRSVGAQTRFINDVQLDDEALGADLARHAVAVAPALYSATDATVAALRRYAERGGHLIIGPRFAYTDDSARARAERAPAGMCDAAGVWYDEFSNLATPLGLTGTQELELPPGARATGWADCLVADDAQVLATYRHPFFGRFAAVASRRAGSGRVTTVGTVPNADLARSIATWAMGEMYRSAWRAPDTVVVSTGRSATGAAVWFVHNWSGEPARLTATDRSPWLQDALGGDEWGPGDELALGPWDVRVLVGGPER